MVFKVGWRWVGPRPSSAGRAHLKTELKNMANADLPSLDSVAHCHDFVKCELRCDVNDPLDV